MSEYCRAGGISGKHHRFKDTNTCRFCGENMPDPQPTTKHDELEKVITDERLVAIAFENELGQQLTFEKYKDGIGLEYPTHDYKNLVKELSALITNEQAIRRDERQRCVEDLMSRKVPHEKLGCGGGNLKDMLVFNDAMDLAIKAIKELP